MKTETKQLKIKQLEQTFNNYIKVLKKFETIEKAELNDLSNIEESLRDDIIRKLNQLKEDYF